MTTNVCTLGSLSTSYIDSNTWRNWCHLFVLWTPFSLAIRSLFISTKCGGSSGTSNMSPVMIKYIHPQKVKYWPNVNNPWLCGIFRKYLLAKSGELNAKKMVKLEKYPQFIPIVCAVDAYDKLSGDKQVSAHPSTAISWVAQHNTKIKK